MSNKINSSTIGAGGLISTADGDDGILLIQSNGSTVATFNATGILGDGSQLTSLPAADLSALNATNLTSGTVPDARFPATLPAANGSALTNLTAGNITGGVGKVLQVVTTFQPAIVSGTAAVGGVTAAMISAAITPATTSSKILVFVSLSVGFNTTGFSITSNVYRAGAQIFLADASGSIQRTTTGTAYGGNSRNLSSNTYTGLDSPATASAVTYDVRLGHTDGASHTMYLNRSNSGSNNNEHSVGTSSLTLMEIGA